MGQITPTVLWPQDVQSETLVEWIAAIERMDGAGWPLVLVGNCNEVDPLDGLAMAAFCAARTRQIGLCASVNASTVEPYTLARGLATLDFMSGGRAAWRIEAGSDEARTLELVATVRELFASWQEDALESDADNGLMSNPDKVRAIHHEGEYFQVEGPLNMPRPPQGNVPLIALSDEGAIAAAADLVLNPQTLWKVKLAELPAAPARLSRPSGQSILERFPEA
ncbi:LLM class flavin-dependent oxidoreductase [Croceicoccus sp. Ery5]|uniref:LLM class flavin-dependent oxidoreductase n=1 Tax=Croceicoccus sp. Ery5 TaxID=1703340 RepID=UPI001E5D5641|nr:LLM class flavin-dependent oxidoreductase [Croceicoccus sp. Ery5]